MTDKNEDQNNDVEKTENAIEIVSFDPKEREVTVTHFRDPGIVIPTTIPFSSLEAEPGTKVSLVFPFKDGTMLTYELPPKMEKDSTVVFKIDPRGKGLVKTHFSGMSAEKHIIESQCAGWFRLKGNKEPTVSLKFNDEYEDPALPYQIIRTKINAPSP